jgi:hypothetical protein
MVRPEDIIDGLIRSIKESGKMPSEMNYLGYEASRTGQDGNIKLPIIEVQPIDEIRIREFNTDVVDVKTDEAGNQVGRIYHAEYRLDLQFDVYTAQGSKHSARELGTRLWSVLYQHDSAGPNRQLPAEGGGEMDASWQLEVGDGQPAHELETTPTLRRWRIDVSVWSASEFETDDEEYIEDYNFNPQAAG